MSLCITVIRQNEKYHMPGFDLAALAGPIPSLFLPVNNASRWKLYLTFSKFHAYMNKEEKIYCILTHIHNFTANKVVTVIL